METASTEKLLCGMTLFYQSDSDSSDSGLSDTESDLDFSDSLTYSLGDVEVSEEPRRIGRVRKHLLEALLATFSILHAVSPGEGLDSPFGKIESKSPTWKRFCARMDDPWKHLEGCVGEIARNLGDGRIKGISEIVAGLSELQLYAKFCSEGQNVEPHADMNLRHIASPSGDGPDTTRGRQAVYQGYTV